jgi:hypothetical protein
MSYYKNKNENKDLVKVAKTIIDKWTRILENNSINYRVNRVIILNLILIYKKIFIKILNF